MNIVLNFMFAIFSAECTIFEDKRRKLNNIMDHKFILNVQYDRIQAILLLVQIIDRSVQ